MSGTNIRKIDTVKVRELAKELKTVVENVTLTHKYMASETEKLISEWSGESADSYARLSMYLDINMQDWIKNMSEEVEFINEYCQINETFENEHSINNILE